MFVCTYQIVITTTIWKCQKKIYQWCNLINFVNFYGEPSVKRYEKLLYILEEDDESISDDNVLKRAPAVKP